MCYRAEMQQNHMERRVITFELPAAHISHLDRQADYQGCSRAAYLRSLIVRDMERQGPARSNPAP